MTLDVVGDERLDREFLVALIVHSIKRDKALQSELCLIKQHLVNTESIREQNKIHVEQIYKAWVVATGKRDNRPFKNRLHEYSDGGYLTPIDGKHKIFRAEDKFLAI